MKIALCDDQKAVAEELQGKIHSFFEKNHIKGEFIYFERPSELFAYMQEEIVDIIFMDLEFQNKAEDGILWSKKIKQMFPEVLVIILTAYENRYKEGYEAKAFRFMTKPVEEKELSEYLRVGMEELWFTESISLTKRGIPYSVRIRDIYYISVQSGGSEVWTKMEMFCREESLLQWEQRLPSALFFRCHSKYLVNLSQVTKFEHQMVTLVNGEKIPVSRRRWKDFQLAYMRYDTKEYKNN